MASVCDHGTCRKYWEQLEKKYGGCRLEVADNDLWNECKQEEKSDYYNHVAAVNKEERHGIHKSKKVSPDTRSETEKEEEKERLFRSCRNAATHYAVAGGKVVRRPLKSLVEEMYGKNWSVNCEEGLSSTVKESDLFGIL